MSQTGMPVTRSASVTARGTVINLQILPEHRQQPAAVSQVRALVDHGLEGDAHGKKKAGSRRQILILDKSTLQELGLRPCEPCTHIGSLVGVADAAQFQTSLQGRRGQLAKVTAVDREGTIRIGDPVVVIGTRDPTPA